MAYKFQSELAILSGALAPSNDDAFDIGAASKQYKDLYIDGVAYIDVLGADADPTTAYIGGGEIDATVIGGETPAAGSFTTLVANGNVDLGDAATDSVTVTGRFDSDLLPIADSTSDLGSNALQWAELHVDTGYIDAITVTGTSTLAVTTATTISGSGTLKAGGATTLQALTAMGASDLQGAITLSGAGDTALDVANDSFYFRDADGTLKRDTMADYAAALVASEPGFASTGGKLQYDPNSLSAAAIASGDSLSFVDSDDSNIPKKDTVDDLATLFAGNGLAASSAVLALDLNELTAVQIASGDFVAIVDATDNSTKKESIDDIATLFAGNGLSAASAVMAVDLNELSAAAVDVAADSIAIIDANDSNGSRKESIADLVTAMAGAGLTATNGVLSSDASPEPTSHGDANATLVEGMNWSSATFTAARTWTLPASPDAGDVISVKAPSNCSAYALTVSRAGSQTIDGMTAVVLNSDNGAVDFVYVGSDKWVIK